MTLHTLTCPAQQALRTGKADLRRRATGVRDNETGRQWQQNGERERGAADRIGGGKGS